MSTAAAPAPVPAPTAAPAVKPIAPPDEAFWVRYSPHGEFPLSSVSAVALHVLGIGVLLLFGVLLANYFQPPPNRVPVDAVRMAANAGGGGKANGVPDGGRDTGPPAVIVGGDTKPDADTPPPAKRDPITAPGPAPQVQFNDDARRFITSSTGAADPRAIENLMARVRAIGPDSKPSRGGGGSGSGGGTGDGHGKGVGDGSGEGVSKGSLTQREKRMLRWTMHFNTNNGRDYLAQLAGLKAILAVPVSETKDNVDYQLIEDLNVSPAKLVAKDVAALNRIFWYDYDARSVNDIMKVLGLNMRPSHFVAFIPQQLEDELFKLERAKAGSRPEDDIERTHFDVHKGADGYRPVLRNIEYRRR